MITRRFLVSGQFLISAGAIGGVAAGGVLAAHQWLSPAADASRAAVINPDPPLPDAIEVSPEALHNMGLHFANAELRPLVRTVRVPGLVSFNDLRVVQVSPSARSRIEAIEVAVGEPVRSGQRLAIVDNFDLSEARSRVASAKAALAQATVEAATAQAALTRGMDLVRIGGAAESDLERRRAEAARMQAQLHTRQAELQQWQGMEQRLMPIGPNGAQGGVAVAEQGPEDSRAALISPIDGIIDSIHASSGEIVDISRQVFTVADLSTVWVQADVPERDLGAIHEGEVVKVGVDAYPRRVFAGRVTYIADRVDPRTGTAKVRCEVPNPDRALRVNMFATVDIAAPLGRDAILVPDAALQDVNGQKAVFVPAGSDRFAWRAVRPGVSSGGFTELLQGVAAGTQVVANGSFWLKAALLRETIPDEG